MLTKLFVNTKIVLENYKNNEQGVTAIEYGLIAAATAVVIGAAMTPIGAELKTIFNNVITALGGDAV
ncbi:Flp family type IVb pilin [Vibrio cyclitrophicus]|uniref:Flp family type IVb pilin n=1 Tax=Vibrio cyclitrophicus TaxID=47951 RepID=UPI000C81C0BD|nr:Flp family type IVb pilin [Vibrio cyclitrophicus]MCC4773872.1 Flp family type IVb pilin [Vibrio cyclitrophicus]MCC4840428.1 Flp family type IVb pilin [Vibrio cyclitrophicus]PME09535.1 pilus assembly protein [Vibrio cyclitrophicus]PME19401.1 pilus assembly protein [Vibrio cyclitrophicus]PME51164.1 pilus assembly protein [Vibrio cyclitrophicus]